MAETTRERSLRLFFGYALEKYYLCCNKHRNNISTMKLTRIIIAMCLLLFVGVQQADAQKSRKRARSTSRTAAATITKSGTPTTVGGIEFQLYTYKRGETKLNIQYPVSGPEATVNALRKFITKNIFEKSPVAATPEAAMRSRIKDLDRQETLELGVSPTAFLDNKFINIKVSGYDYFRGAAHGMPLDYTTTFRASDGLKFTEDMMPQISKVRPLMAEGFMEYFGCNTPAEVNETLCYGNGVNDIDHYGNVFFNAKGLNIEYGSYDIGPYAIGCPVCTIPYDKITPLLGQKARDFFAGAINFPSTENNDTDSRVYFTPEQAPQYPGGLSALMSHLAENISYPANAVTAQIQGRVLVKFVVKKDGSVGEVEIVRGVDPSLDNEAIRVVKTLNGFIPGKMNGTPVNCWYTLPITFRLGQ